MIVSCHTHTESAWTGSTILSMIKRAVSLKRSYLAVTDNGSLTSSLKSYGLIKKEGLKPILGLEIYFKDQYCEIISKSKANRCKYYTGTIYCRDQNSYQALVRIVSGTDFKNIIINEESHSLWEWKHLEELSTYNTDFVLGGQHCMVGKNFIAGDSSAAEKVFLKLKNIFNKNLYTSVIAEPWTKKWGNVIKVEHNDSTKTTVYADDMVTTDKAKNIKAIDLVEKKHHSVLKSIINNNVYSEINKPIEKATLHSGFLPLNTDITTEINRFLLELSKKHNINVLVSDYAYYSEKEDKPVQTMKFEGRTKIHSNFHMKTKEEIDSYLKNTLGFNQEYIDKIHNNNTEWAQKYDNFKLEYKLRLAEVEGDQSAIQKIISIIKEKGRMDWNNKLHVDRLREEIDVIHRNGKLDLSPYFLPIYDVVNFYKENGRLNGPGRGSASGSFIAYLLGITEVNPFLYDLSFSRFYSLDRIFANKIADIDTDLEDRELLVGKDGKSGYLYGRWGNKAAQISTRQNLRLKSAIKDVNRYASGKVESYIENLSKNLPAAPTGISDTNFVFGYEDEDGNHIPGLLDTNESLREYVKNRPNEWSIVQKTLGIVKSQGTHACAFVISDEPISNTIPIREGHITQPEAKEVEAAGLVKMDFLVVKQLKDIRVCIDFINKKNNDTYQVGYFTHNSKKTYIWDLPEDLPSYQSIWGGSTEACFQINTQSMVPYVMGILPKCIEDLSLVLSLVRPGPLDFKDPDTGRNMAEEYIYRRNGNSYEDIEILKELIPETYSVLVYQEQITKIAKNLAGFSGLEAENLREAIGKKKTTDLAKMKPKFIQGAVNSGKTSQNEAETLWDRIEKFGRYAFNKSHGISYSYITYACMFLKYYYPLEFWAAILSNAEEKEISGKFWPYVKDLVMPPDINLSTDTMVVDYTNNKIRSKLGIIRGMGEKSIEPIVKNRPYKDIQDFVDKEVAGDSLSHKLIHVGILDSLFPPNLNLIEKLKMYQQAVENKIYANKVKKAQAERRKLRILQPREGVVPEEYINISPMKDVAMRKSVLPSLPIDLNSIGAKHSKVAQPFSKKPLVISKYNKPVPLIGDETFKRLSDTEGINITEDIYVAATCYIIEMKEFSFANNTKKALKLIVDSGNYISEKIMWPDYNGKLNYPPDLKKGCIATIFLKKRPNKKDMQITEIVVET